MLVVGYAAFQHFFGVDSGGLPNGAVTYSYLAHRPESHLFYPGATVFRELGADQGCCSAGFAGAILRTQATDKELYDWYDGQLLSQGWRRNEISPLSTEVSAQGYRRGNREYLTVGVDDPRMLGATIGQNVPSGVTVYEVTYTVDRAS